MNACSEQTSSRFSQSDFDGPHVSADGQLTVVEPAAAGVAIRCLAGDAWVTQAGIRDDFVMKAGDTFVTPHAGKVVVQAGGHARIHVEPLAEPMVLRAGPVVIRADLRFPTTGRSV